MGINREKLSIRNFKNWTYIKYGSTKFYRLIRRLLGINEFSKLNISQIDLLNDTKHNWWLKTSHKYMK